MSEAAGIACIDHKVTAGATPTTGTITIVLRNGMGFDATGVSVTASGCTAAGTGTITNGEKANFGPSGCTLTSGSKYSGDVNVTYTNADTSLTHKVQGSITARAE